MRLEIIAATSTEDKDHSKKYYNMLSGKLAGICYNEESFEKLKNEEKEATIKRIVQTLGSGHHSVYEHEYITLYLENVPKLFAMILNNEKVYVTSEKSARYTKMQAEGIEKQLYDKWNAIFVEEITKRYPNEQFLDANKIKKLAQENARYFLSIYNPTTCMAYTTSYRQLNYLYGWLRNIDKHPNELMRNLASFANEFCDNLDKLGLIDERLCNDGKGRDISLISTSDRERVEYFGDVYCTTYDGSWAQLAQAQRHRTINYEVKPMDPPAFYVPKLIRNNEKLKAEWLNDMKEVKDNHPQGELVHIIERGTPENFVLKCYERLCSNAQQEIMEQTALTMKNYNEKAIDEEIAQMFKKYSKGARCTFPGFECKKPCNFKEGITLDREI